MPLTPKQERFCLEYQVDNNATQAAIRAGYSERSAAMQGNRLMQHDEIKARVAELAAESASRTETDADYVRTKLRRVIDLGLADAETMEGAEGVLTPARRRELTAAVQALDKLARLNGLYGDKAQIDGDITIRWQD